MKNWQIVLLFSLVLIIGFGTWPLYQKREAQQTELAELTAKKNQLAAEFKNVQQNFEALQSETDSPFTEIPQNYDQAQLLEDVLQLTTQNGFSVENFQFGLSYNAAVETDEINVRFELEGARSSIANFLQDVEEFPRFLGVESLQLTSGDNRRSKMGVSLYSFFRAS